MTIVAMPGNAAGITTDSTNLYYVDSRAADAGGAIYRFDTTADASVALASADNATVVGVDSQNAYFDVNDNGTSLESVALDGGAPTQVATATSIADIYVNTSGIFYSGAGSNLVLSVVDGGATSIGSVGKNFALVADATYVYLASDNGGYDQKPSVVRVRIDGTSYNGNVCVTDVYWGESWLPNDDPFPSIKRHRVVAIDSTHIYFASHDPGGDGIYALTKQ